MGFTLIELLIVIAIVGLLSAMIFFTLNDARAKARDTRRIADLRQIATALEAHINATGGYPGEAGWCDSSKGVTATNCVGFSGNFWPSGGGLITLETAGSISKLPVDPLNNTDFFYYYEPVNNQTQFGTRCATPPCAYILSARLESSSPHKNPGCLACLPSRDYCISGGGAKLGASC